MVTTANVIGHVPVQQLVKPVYRKLDEIPYDFIRKHFGIMARQEQGGAEVMVCKGALQNVLEVCDGVQSGTTSVPLDEDRSRDILRRFTAWSAEGNRVPGVAQKYVEPADRNTRQDEQGMVFVGFLLFFDPLEEGVRQPWPNCAGSG